MPIPLSPAESRGNASTLSSNSQTLDEKVVSLSTTSSISPINPIPSWPKMAPSLPDEQASTKASLRAWWAAFTKPRLIGKDKKHLEQRVFGAPLRQSLKYASVAISLAEEDGQQYVWGYVPIIVAKIGLYLKENATEVEGVFRIAGSQKRMKELQETFDTPPRYGKSVDWSKYSVHDAASVLRRYLNHMPEPIVPLDLYTEFRNVMAKDPFEAESAIKTYRLLINSMPPANQYLLLYVLDLLAVFARKSDMNLMPASNLAVIFQPGMFSHPSHVQSPIEHKLAVQVLEFLIQHQDQFILGMSPQPTNFHPNELTAVSRPLQDEELMVPSDSDEDQGELEVHEGGGARLMRSLTSKPKKASNRRRGRRAEEGESSGDSNLIEFLTKSATRTEEKSTTDTLTSLLPIKSASGLRRSRTVPSRKAADSCSPETKARKPRRSAGLSSATVEETLNETQAEHNADNSPSSPSAAKTLQAPLMQKAFSAIEPQNRSLRSPGGGGNSERGSLSMARAASAAAPTLAASTSSTDDTAGLPTPPSSKIVSPKGSKPNQEEP